MKKINYIPDGGDLDADYCTGRDMMNAARSLIRTASGKFKTDVTFGGDSAFTDGEHVNLPSLPEDIMVTKRQGLVTSGFGLHETLHQLMTDFNGVAVQMQGWSERGQVFTKHLANAMEDFRIERGGLELQPGIPKSVDKTAEMVNREFLDVHYAEDNSIVNDIKSIGPVAVTWEGRRRLGYPSALNDECLALLPDNVRTWVNQVCDAVEAMPHGVEGQGKFNQADAFDGCKQLHNLAEKIANDLGQQRNPDGTPTNTNSSEHPEQPTRDGRGSRPDGQDDGNADGTGDQGTAGSSGDADTAGSSGTDTQDGAGTAEGEGSSGGDTHTHSLDKSDSDGQDDGGNTNAHGAGEVTAVGDDDWQRTLEAPIIDPNLDNVVKGMFDQMKQQGGGSYRPFSRDFDTWCVVKGSNFKHPSMEVIKRIVPAPDAFAKSRKKMGNQLGTMRRKLERGLVSESRSRFESRKMSGRLDTRRLTDLANYRTDVFRRRVISEAIDTALMINIDLSGSMQGYEAELAQHCAIAIVEALQGTNVAVEVTGHNTRITSRRDRWGFSGAEQYNRNCAISNYLFKEFEQTLAQARGGLGAIANCTGGANADGDAWMYSYDRLMARPEKRKVMMVMSDGHPAYDSDFGDQYQHTRDVVERMSIGADVVGIGINDASVKQFFPRYVVVTDLNDLPKHVMDQLGKMLLGETFAVDNSDLITTDRDRAKNCA